MTKELNFHFLNAGRGDSIVIEFVSETNQYVVIDCNLATGPSGLVNPAYEFLKSRNAEGISTLIITHFHFDHYNGVEKLLHNFEIERIVIPPFFSLTSEAYNQILDIHRKNIIELVKSSADDEIIQQAKSLAFLLVYLTNNDAKVEEVVGRESILRFPGVEDITALVYLPLKKIKGRLFQLIASERYNLDNFPEINDSSIAIRMTCYDYNVLLSGDSTLPQWREHKRQMAIDKIVNLAGDCLKAPHHGSKENNTERLYEYLFRPNNEQKCIVISANGMRHPDKEIFHLINKFDLLPYCTNLSPQCLSPNVLLFEAMTDIPPEMRPFLLHYRENEPIPCQGDITLSIGPKRMNIENSTGTLCVYR